MLITEILTLLWLVVALVTWLITHIKSRKYHKVTNTLQMINNLSTVACLQEADLRIRKEIRAGKALDPHAIDEAVEDRLITVLDYYEFLAQLYWEGAVDRPSLLHLRGRLIVELCNAASDYITYWQAESNRPDLYRRLQELGRDFAAKGAE